jgi:hypothetical protein
MLVVLVKPASSHSTKPLEKFYYPAFAGCSGLRQIPNSPFSVWGNFAMLVSLQDTTDFPGRFRNRPPQIFSRCRNCQWLHRGRALYF